MASQLSPNSRALGNSNSAGAGGGYSTPYGFLRPVTPTTTGLLPLPGTPQQARGFGGVGGSSAQTPPKTPHGMFGGAAGLFSSNAGPAPSPTYHEGSRGMLTSSQGRRGVSAGTGGVAAANRLPPIGSLGGAGGGGDKNTNNSAYADGGSASFSHYSGSASPSSPYSSGYGGATSMVNPAMVGNDSRMGVGGSALLRQMLQGAPSTTMVSWENGRVRVEDEQRPSTTSVSTGNRALGLNSSNLVKEATTSGGATASSPTSAVAAAAGKKRTSTNVTHPQTATTTAAGDAAPGGAATTPQPTPTAGGGGGGVGILTTMTAPDNGASFANTNNNNGQLTTMTASSSSPSTAAANDLRGLTTAGFGIIERAHPFVHAVGRIPNKGSAILISLPNDHSTPQNSEPGHYGIVITTSFVLRSAAEAEEESVVFLESPVSGTLGKRPETEPVAVRLRPDRFYTTSVGGNGMLGGGGDSSSSAGNNNGGTTGNNNRKRFTDDDHASFKFGSSDHNNNNRASSHDRIGDDEEDTLGYTVVACNLNSDANPRLTIGDITPLPLPILVSKVPDVKVGDTHLFVTHNDGRTMTYQVGVVTEVFQHHCVYEHLHTNSILSSGGAIFDSYGNFVGIQHQCGENSFGMFIRSLVIHLFDSAMLGPCRVSLWGDEEDAAWELRKGVFANYYDTYNANSAGNMNGTGGDSALSINYMKMPSSATTYGGLQSPTLTSLNPANPAARIVGGDTHRPGSSSNYTSRPTTPSAMGKCYRLESHDNNGASNSFGNMLKATSTGTAAGLPPTSPYRSHHHNHNHSSSIGASPSSTALVASAAAGGGSGGLMMTPTRPTSSKNVVSSEYIRSIYDAKEAEAHAGRPTWMARQRLRNVGPCGGQLLEMGEFERFSQWQKVRGGVPETMIPRSVREVFAEWHTDYQSLILMLHAFPYNERMVLLVLEKLTAHENRAFVPKVAAMGGVGILLHTLDLHPFSEKLMEAGITAIARLSVTYDNKQAIARCDGVAVITAVMFEYASNHDLQQWATYALMNLTHDSPSASDSVRSLVQAQGVEKVIHNMRVFPNARHLQRWSAMLLVNVLRGGEGGMIPTTSSAGGGGGGFGLGIGGTKSGHGTTAAATNNATSSSSSSVSPSTPNRYWATLMKQARAVNDFHDRIEGKQQQQQANDTNKTAANDALYNNRAPSPIASTPATVARIVAPRRGSGNNDEEVSSEVSSTAPSVMTTASTAVATASAGGAWTRLSSSPPEIPSVPDYVLQAWSIVLSTVTVKEEKGPRADTATDNVSISTLGTSSSTATMSKAARIAAAIQNGSGGGASSTADEDTAKATTTTTTSVDLLPLLWRLCYVHKKDGLVMQGLAALLCELLCAVPAAIVDKVRRRNRDTIDRYYYGIGGDSYYNEAAVRAAIMVSNSRGGPLATVLGARPAVAAAVGGALQPSSAFSTPKRPSNAIITTQHQSSAASNGPLPRKNTMPSKPIGDGSSPSSSSGLPKRREKQQEEDGVVALAGPSSAVVVGDGVASLDASTATSTSTATAAAPTMPKLFYLPADFYASQACLLASNRVKYPTILPYSKGGAGPMLGEDEVSARELQLRKMPEVPSYDVPSSSTTTNTNDTDSCYYFTNFLDFLIEATATHGLKHIRNNQLKERDEDTIYEEEVMRLITGRERVDEVGGGGGGGEEGTTTAVTATTSTVTSTIDNSPALQWGLNDARSRLNALLLGQFDLTTNIEAYRLGRSREGHHYSSSSSSNTNANNGIISKAYPNSSSTLTNAKTALDKEAEKRRGGGSSNVADDPSASSLSAKPITSTLSRRRQSIQSSGDATDRGASETLLNLCHCLEATMLQAQADGVLRGDIVRAIAEAVGKGGGTTPGALVATSSADRSTAEGPRSVVATVIAAAKHNAAFNGSIASVSSSATTSRHTSGARLIGGGGGGSNTTNPTAAARADPYMLDAITVPMLTISRGSQDGGVAGTNSSGGHGSNGSAGGDESSSRRETLGSNADDGDGANNGRSNSLKNAAVVIPSAVVRALPTAVKGDYATATTATSADYYTQYHQPTITHHPLATAALMTPTNNNNTNNPSSSSPSSLSIAAQADALRLAEVLIEVSYFHISEVELHERAKAILRLMGRGDLCDPERYPFLFHASSGGGSGGNAM